jgi:hypothetical protein
VIASPLTASSACIERAANAKPSFIQHMLINHCGFDIFVAQEFLYCSDIVVVLQKLGGKTMAKGMTTDALVNTCQTFS